MQIIEKIRSNQMEQLPTDAIEQFIHGDNSYDDSERYKARIQLANLLSALKEAQGMTYSEQ